MNGRPFMKPPTRSSAIYIFFGFLLVGAFVSTRLLNTSSIADNSEPKSKISYTDPPIKDENPKKPPGQIEIPLNCEAYNQKQTCPSEYPTTFNPEEDPDRPLPITCPDYFRWIHEDLHPWAHTGITRETLESAKKTANFRLVIVKGKAYVETYIKGFQTRDVFTLWGILQLLRRYPGQLPDLEMMFDCVDWPIVKASDYQETNATDPPPLFRYCGDNATLDIVFPDWSFWGWAEINIKPWELLLKDLKEGNTRTKWLDREPYAYWKGNPAVAETRQDLMKCNVSDNEDWNARLYAQDWLREIREGYKQSNLASQCVHRYKIYIEGSAWSVSEKYILACDSVPFIVTPHYYDFFTRGLMPVQHYWPIREDDKCRSIKFAVDWGNSHKRRAQGIGKTSSEFIQEELKMEYVYDYMFHLLKEYSKLLTFEPTIPKEAIEFCGERMACPAEGTEKQFMMDSLVKGPTYSTPCIMPDPYDPPSLNAFLRKKENSIKQVEKWEKIYWENQNKKP